ncbi:MAG: hypothetical protein KKG21_04670 [Candidatus Omnitrophica bacterium]|nr:hypothetical protein [Candidatus Omnitrophota bacterium]
MANIFTYLRHTSLILRSLFRKPNKPQEMVRFICTFCAAEENIPKDVVDDMDKADNRGNMSYPPRFTCSVCPDGLMQPVDYNSPSGRTYKTDPKSIKPAQIISF